MKSLFAYLGFGLRGRVLVWHKHRGLQNGHSRNKADGHHFWALPHSHSSLLVSPRKEFVLLPGAPIFVAASRDTLPWPGFGGKISDLGEH